MVNDPAPPPAPPAEKKKSRPEFKSKMALLEIIDRKRLNHRVDYGTVAARHGVKPGSLRMLYMRWTRGEIDLGEPQTPEERAIDARMQHEKSLELMRRYKALLLINFERALFEAEDETTKGNTEGWRQTGLQDLTNEYRKVHSLTGILEKGYLAVVDEYRAQEMARSQKTVGAPEGLNVQVQTANANEEMRALEALRVVSTQ